MSKEEAAEDREKKNKQETSKKYSLLTFSATDVQRTRGNAHHRRIVQRTTEDDTITTQDQHTALSHAVLHGD